MVYMNFKDFKSKVKLDYNLDDEDYKSGLDKVGRLLVREMVEKSPGLKRCPPDLLNSMVEWAVNYYPPSEIQRKLENLETLAVDFMTHNPNEVTHGEIANFLGRDGKLRLTKSPFEKEINIEDFELDENQNEIRRKPKVKPQRQPIELPSEKAVREMPLSDLDKLIKDAKESLKDEL